MVIPTARIGIPALLHFPKNLGAHSSRARAYRLLDAQDVKVLPAEKTLVTSSAFVR